ncbi:hypothetical protein FXO38_26197 [Capsicum annuum]|uniref:Chaperonin CPN60-2, mitochondrial n=1 Tax=Capsicum annuum TaxID=4072 RepID=A0A2G2ZYD1_CAPAN|nr:hypothetical protein FXO38_26197 [Capsicum annuum]KAF3654774.1 hypothetical protein FXO37_16299 [Capsicum annuum]PHT86990.1 hypothetical protein T459_09096 [Capsicum annuum]
MYRLTAKLASKFRVARSTTQQVGSRLNWRRNYVAKDIKFGVEAWGMMLQGDQKISVEIIQNVLKIPVHTIAFNSGVEGPVVVGKLLEQDNTDLGYDKAKGEYVDMVKTGIINPFKVIRTILVDVACVSSLLTTTKVVIVEQPKDEKASPAMPGGGMDY